jgi:hypothetical protein
VPWVELVVVVVVLVERMASIVFERLLGGDMSR